MTSPKFSLAVYCGSRTGTQPAFAYAAAEVGRWLGAHDGQLVYGGGKNGLMGVVAQATLESGGRVVGVIPKDMVEREWANHDCTELHIVETMAQRKAMMIARADAYLALPGGIGTLEEILEVWTLHTLGYLDKPVGLLNTNGFYDPLLGFFQSATDHELLSTWQTDMLMVQSEPESLLDTIMARSGRANAN